MDPRPRPGLLVLLLIALPHAGCVVGDALRVDEDRTTVSVELGSAAFGNLSLAPTACASGEHALFQGADFLDGQGVTTRLILDPTGAASLRLFKAAQALDPGVLIRRQDCGRFEVSFERTGWQVNDVYDLRVRLDFDCRTPAGDTATGSLAAEHCH